MLTVYIRRRTSQFGLKACIFPVSAVEGDYSRAPQPHVLLETILGTFDLSATTFPPQLMGERIESVL